jgi:hypothetical protein
LPEVPGTVPYGYQRKPFRIPGLWQNYIEKKREWRITVVGDSFFEVTITTMSPEAAVDWRRYQEDERQVQFGRGRFPNKEKKKCIEYLNRSSCSVGAVAAGEAGVALVGVLG